jgi:hypothetical protein
MVYSEVTPIIFPANICRNFFKQQQLRMDDLRRRLHFHSLKIRLVIDRLSVSLLTDVDSKLDAVLAITTENLQLSRDTLDEIRLLRHLLLGSDPVRQPPVTQRLLEIPPALAMRFERALQINAPKSYRPDLPLAESFDALWYRFGVSVQGSSTGPERFMQMVKCCWILEQIKMSTAYQEASPAFYYRRAVTQVDIALRTGIRRLDSNPSYDICVLLALPDEMFEIWLPPSRPPPAVVLPQQPNPILLQGGERQVVSLKLAADEGQAPDMIHVFQIGDENYRIALETSTQTGERYIREQPLYTREHRLIPRYALPTMPDPVPEIAVFSHGRCHIYQFQNYNDLWKFQTAFTGYEVSHYQPAVRCQFGPNLDSFVCDGHVQFWQEPIDFRSPSTSSAIAPNVRAKGASSLKSRQASLAPSLGQTTNFTSTPEALIAHTVKSSALVIYTQFTHLKNDHRFAIIVLELDDNIHIDREACACKHGYDGCSKLVLAAKKKTPLPLRMVLSTDVAGQQDPNTFDIMPLRLPRRPDYTTIKVRESEHIVLKFESLEAKRGFDREFQDRFAVRVKQREHMADIERRFFHMANHPQRRDQYRPQPDQNHSGALFPRSGTLDSEPAPRLAEPELGPPLQVHLVSSPASTRSRAVERRPDPSLLSSSPLSNVSSFGSVSAGSRSNSTPSTDWERDREPPTTVTGRMAAQLSGYNANSRVRSSPVAQQNLARPVERGSAAQTPGRSFNQTSSTPSSHPALWPTATRTNSDLFASGGLGRRDTAATIQSTKTTLSGSTAQTP